MDETESRSLSIAFRDSLAENIISCVEEYAELGIDAILDDGVLKDIPIVSTAVAIYKMGNSIHDRHNLKKLAVFLDEINKGIINNEQRLEYQNQFQANEKTGNEQLEYLMILIDRYTSYDKPRMLAKLFMAYLDGKIGWEELTMYAEVIDRFLLIDYSALVSDETIFIFHHNKGTESVLRLAALGLVLEDSNSSLFEPDGRGGYAITNLSMNRIKSKQRIYRRTEFGEKLADILR